MGSALGKRGLALLAAAILYIWAAALCVGAERGTENLLILLDRPADAGTAAELFDRESAQEQPVGFCFRGEIPGRWASCPQTGRSARVSHVVLAGNPELLGAGSLAWQDGCLIDPETAKALFGTDVCGGQVLSLDGQTYRVLGTLPALQPTLVALAREEDGGALTQCVLALPPEKGAGLSQPVLLRLGVSGTAVECYPLWALTKDFLLILPALVLLTLVRRLVRGWRGLTWEGVVSRRQLRRLGRLALGLALLLVGGRLLLGQVVIPPDMIPSKWSDFSFWGTWLEAQRENLFRILQAPLGNEQLQMLLDMVKSMVSSTAAAMLTLWAMGRDDRADTAD